MRGEPELIHAILHWILQRKDELKKRAYVSRFLLKIDVPADMNSDSDVADLLEQVTDVQDHVQSVT